MIKKSVCLFFVVFVVLAVGGCARKPGGRTVITYWDSMSVISPTGIGIQSLIEEFEKKNPHIKIRYQHVPGAQMDMRFQTAVVGGVPPDVVLIDRFITATYASLGALTPLDSLIEKYKINPDDFWPAVWEEVVYNDQVWAIPHHTDARALFYRVDHFKEVGLDPDHPPETWDELREYAEKLTKRGEGGRLERIGFLPYYGNTWLHLWGWLNEGEFMVDGKPTVNDPRIVEALEWTVAFEEELYGGFRALAVATSGYGTREMCPFIMGKLSMIINIDLFISDLERFGPEIDFRVAPPPAPEGKETLTWSGGFALTIPKGARHPEEAWEFIRFMTSEEAQLEYAKMSSRIPALVEAARDPFFTDHPKHRVFLELMEVSRHRPVSPVAAFMWDELRRAIEYARVGRKTSQEALDNANERIKEEFQRRGLLE